MPTPTRPPRGHAPAALRTVVLALLLGVLLAGPAACTGDEPEAAPARSTPTSSASADASPASVPLEVRVTRVNGRLPASARGPLEANVGRVLRSYVAGAFVGGDYPRSDFGAAFADFTPGARQDAARDVRLLTNASYGAGTTSVRAVKGSAYLSVLAPNRTAAGITAKVDLVFRVERREDRAQRVRLRGAMLLTRGPDNGWRVFGYRVNRSDTPVRGAS